MNIMLTTQSQLCATCSQLSANGAQAAHNSKAASVSNMITPAFVFWQHANKSKTRSSNMLTIAVGLTATCPHLSLSY